MELGDAAMKKTLFLLCLLSTTAAFAQVSGSISSEPHVYEFAGHPGQASYAPMAHERNILANASFSFAQGDRPALDFPHPAVTAEEAVSLGTVARELRQEHAQVKKSRVVWVNQ
jgi:hypothetical protein